VTAVVIRDRDVARLNRCLELLAGPTSIDALRRQAVDAIPELVASAFTVWNEFDPTAGEMSAPVISATTVGIRGGAEQLSRAMYDARATFAAHVDEQPIMRHYALTGDGRPRAISDFYSEEQFRGTELYRQFYGPLGVDDQIAFQLPSSSLVVAVTLHRGWDDFPPLDRLLLNLLRPQLIQALRNARAYERLCRMLAATEQQVERTGEGLLLLDRAGRVEYASTNARAILGRWFGEWRHQQLPSRLEDWTRGQRSLDRPTAPPWPLILERHGRQLAIRRLPVPEDDAVALLVTERDIDQDGRAVLSRLGLTPRQSEVLDLATRGATNAQIAAALRISLSTVEAHMTQALAKLGVQSRVAAANLLHQSRAERSPEAS
jgi:DNA-binding CsgD family transcriptional regulator